MIMEKMGKTGKMEKMGRMGKTGLMGPTRHTLMPPRGYSIAGVSGSCGQWVDGFSLIIKQG